jgi:hypothetical protein
MVAMALSIYDNVFVNDANLTFLGQIIWVVINTICSWFYVISYVLTHAMYN